MVKIKDLKNEDTVYLAKVNGVFDICINVINCHSGYDDFIDTYTDKIIADIIGFDGEEISLTEHDEKNLFLNYQEAKLHSNELLDEYLEEDDYLYQETRNRRLSCSRDRCNDGCEYYYDCWC